MYLIILAFYISFHESPAYGGKCEQALFVDVHKLYQIAARWILHCGGSCFQNPKIDRRRHVPEKRLWHLRCSFQANTCLCAAFKHSTDYLPFFLQHFKQILIRETEKDRTESSEEADFFREKYMPLNCLKQIGFVAFSPDSEQAYNPWLSLCFTVCRLSSGISKLPEKNKKNKKSPELFTGNSSFCQNFVPNCGMQLQHKCQR